jgi:hypothetical protein
VAGCALALGYYGLRRIDLVLLGVGAAGLALGLVCLVSTSLGALRIWRAARRLPESAAQRLECGYWARTELTLPSLWYLPFVTVGWRWLEPRAQVRGIRRRGVLREEVMPERRGHIDVITRAFEIGDIFGLCRIRFTVRQAGEVRFMPWMGALRQMNVLRGMSAGEDISHPDGPPEGDRYDMRHYEAGDPIRFILWKVFAKSRELLIRTPERALSHARQTAVYMVAGAADEPSAGAARMALDYGAFGGEWVLGADGSSELARSKDARAKDLALELLSRSAHVREAQAGAGLATFLKNATTKGAGRVVVFVPPRPGPWLARVVEAARAHGRASVQFIVGIDGLERDADESRVSRWALRRVVEHESPLAAVSSGELGRVVTALGQDALIVDRVRGQIFSGHVLGRASPRAPALGSGAVRG